jgi:hypothetical protein
MLNVGLGAFFGNVQDWKGVWQEADDVSNMNAYVTNDKDFLLHSQWVLHRFS